MGIDSVRFCLAFHGQPAHVVGGLVAGFGPLHVSSHPCYSGYKSSILFHGSENSPEAHGWGWQPDKHEVGHKGHHHVGEHKVELLVEALPAFGELRSPLGADANADLQ